jgi:hypothetical protein
MLSCSISRLEFSIEFHGLVRIPTAHRAAAAAGDRVVREWFIEGAPKFFDLDKSTGHWAMSRRYREALS